MNDTRNNPPDRPMPNAGIGHGVTWRCAKCNLQRFGTGGSKVRIRGAYRERICSACVGAV